jgi:hypothetical protein
LSLDNLEKLRSIRQGGKTKGKARVRQLSEGGRVRGYEVDYGDGRRAAVVRPDTIQAKFSISRQEETE